MFRRRSETAVQRHFREAVGEEVMAQLKDVPTGPVECAATVLVARLVGFADLASGHREEVPGTLNRFVNVVARAVDGHGGSFEVLLGARAQASFGTPLLGGTALGARRAAEALAAHAAGEAALPVAVGVATGPCWAGIFGSEGRMFGLCAGEAAERAYALCEAAAPGEVRVDDETLALVREVEPGAG